MAFARSQRARKAEYPDHNQQHRPSVPNTERALPTKLANQKEQAQRDDHRGAHQAPDAAALAVALNAVAHFRASEREAS
jgi:hypothetical protein